LLKDPPKSFRIIWNMPEISSDKSSRNPLNPAPVAPPAASGEGALPDADAVSDCGACAAGCCCVAAGADGADEEFGVKSVPTMIFSSAGSLFLYSHILDESIMTFYN
jgi:hypothetical protein